MARRGRPPRAGVRATRVIRLLVTDAEYAAIQAMARTRGLTVADEIRLALLDWAYESGTEPPVEI